MPTIPQMNTLRFEQDGHVARLTMNRPEKLNAFSVEMWDEMRELGDRLLADPGDVRALVLIGEGRAFSSGIDTSVFVERGDFGSVSGSSDGSAGRDPWIDTVLRTQDAYNWLEEAPFATIAAVLVAFAAPSHPFALTAAPADGQDQAQVDPLARLVHAAVDLLLQLLDRHGRHQFNPVRAARPG